ncbi:hypothetical protein Slin14017_G035820 [Septoria linicola]|nr:hypothetical protein Slin14017_G035820 [Septoria linicola]
MAHAWSGLPSALSAALPKANKAAQTHGELKAFADSNAITEPATFGIKAAGSDKAIVITVQNGKVDISGGTTQGCSSALSALPEQWQEFMKTTPVMPYQSFWGMFGMNIKQEGISIDGDMIEFARWTHIWRRVLELVHDAHAGETPADQEPEVDTDHIVGRYVYLKDIPIWGKCKVFYEESGSGDQEIVFLHTAGSDSR